MRAAFVMFLAVAAAGAGVCCTRSEAPNHAEPSGTSGTSPLSSAAPRAVAAHPFPRPAEATLELGVLSEVRAPDLEKLVAKEKLPFLLAARHCGPPSACDALRAFVKNNVTVRVTTAEDWGLPPQSTWETVAASLSAAERATIGTRPNVVVVHAKGPRGPEQLAARAGFALTAAIAERLHGLVYDETLRRIETASGFATHAVTASLGDPVFREDRVTIQLYEQDDGTARLISLGMRRFGAPDLEIRGAETSVARRLGSVLNAVGAQLASGAETAPLTVSFGARSASVDLVVPPLQAGDPDNSILRIVPSGGATPRGYDELAQALFGAVEHLVESPDERALSAATERAAGAFPAVLARWKASPAPRPSLAVRLPFAIPGGAGVEWMWMEVTGADGESLSGRLANTPAYVTDLQSGAAVKGRKKDVSDYLLALPDGGKEGGETIRILESQK